MSLSLTLVVLTCDLCGTRKQSFQVTDRLDEYAAAWAARPCPDHHVASEATP